MHGFSESIIYGIDSTQKHRIEEDIAKFKMKLFIIVISIAIVLAGIFAIIWGIASYIDTRFAMQGLGFVLIGIIAILIGTLLYKRTLHYYH
jgi:ABC-type anion transport system duplicated permease subunit